VRFYEFFSLIRDALAGDAVRLRLPRKLAQLRTLRNNEKQNGKITIFKLVIDNAKNLSP
jgi:hypothetical protein